MPNKSIPYDPVPPYDLEDVEASASTAPSQPQPADAPSNEAEAGNVVELQRERRLSQRECCNYGLAYFITAVVGVIIIVSIIVKRR
jgi:hypothetical protein